MADTIGFIGLGIMGKPMAKNLIKSGCTLIVCDINTDAVNELVSAGATAAASPRVVAESANIIITMLPNSPQVLEVVSGKDGVLAGVKAGSVLIDMSSIDPNASKEVAAALAEKGCEMLDAPVSGGEPKAVDGSLAIMVGGKESVFDAHKELLLHMGASAVHIGDIGSGNVAKLCNQMIVALNIAALSEAMTLAAKSGVDPEKVFEAIRGGLAGSTVMNAKTPMILDRNFAPGFRMELHIKDLLNAVNAVQASGSVAPLTRLALDMMYALKNDSLEKEDHSALVKYYEKLANITVE